jgi:DNA-binding CsgD family transcriptional regulator
MMPGMTGEIIGRDAERSTIAAFLDRSTSEPAALVIEGQPGIGKTTLWSAGVDIARERSARVLTSRPAATERTLPYVVLGDLFGEVPDEILAALPVPRRLAFETALLRADPGRPVDPRALGVAIATILPMLADGHPLVLAIDDDQWIDPSSAATLAFALRRTRSSPVLLLLARRTDGASGPGLEVSIGQADPIRLPVGPLSVGAIQVLLRHRLDMALPRPRLLRLHEGSGGNPFYAIELARAQAADPARDPSEPIAVPRTLELLLASRLDELDGSTRHALLLVAANGRLPVALLRSLAIAPEALHAARVAEVIETGEGVVRFTHPLLASTLYQRAPDEDRRAAHRILADALDDPIDRGRHLALASDAPDERLAATLEAAAGVARQRGMPIAAAELAEHAVHRTPPDEPDDVHRRSLLAARAHLEAGDGGRGRAILTELLARVPAGPKRAEALVLWSDLEEAGVAVGLLREALHEVAAFPALAASVHIALAGLVRLTQGAASAEPDALIALRLAERVDDVGLRAAALEELALQRFDRAREGALELAERADRLATPSDADSQVTWHGDALGFILSHSGEFDRARGWLESRLDLWRDRDEQVRSGLLWYLAVVEVWSGRLSVAGEYADQVQEINAQYGESGPDHLIQALVAMHRGDFALARTHSHRALSLAKAHLLPQHPAILGVCDLWSGDPAGALVHFATADQYAETRDWHEPNMRWWRAETAEALIQLGRVDEADDLIDDWEAAATRLHRRRVLALTVRCRGLIAAARGDLPVASRLLAEAVDRHQAAGDPFGRARALFSLGVVGRRARQKRATREALEAALAAFEALGAASWAAATRIELARIGGRGRIEGLSPSERGVAALVAKGLTNREVAATLYLGERTVAGHLTHVYAKLGIRSRTELARLVQADGGFVPADGEPVPEDASNIATS